VTAEVELEGRVSASGPGHGAVPLFKGIVGAALRSVPAVGRLSSPVQVSPTLGCEIFPVGLVLRVAAVV